MLDSGVPKLVQQYVTTVLINMQRDIQAVVKKAIQDAFPAAWLEEEGDEVAHSGSVYFVICTRVRQRRRMAADVENETRELHARYAVAKMLMVKAEKNYFSDC